MKHRFHVVGLPNYPCSKAYPTCAYGQKVWKFCKMMTDRGHEVFHYGVEGSDPPCTEHFNTLSWTECHQFFGDLDQSKGTSPIVWDGSLPYWQISNAKANYHIRKNLKPRDFVCVIAGAGCHSHLSDLLSDQPVDIVEFGIGYYGTFAKFKVYESQAHRHYVTGKYAGLHSDPDGMNYDAVIPNYFDLDDFTVNLQPKDYYLFMGRMITRKGIWEAWEACRRAGVRLIMCGQGGQSSRLKCAVHADGHVLHDVEYVNYADVMKRDQLMGNAIAIICPTKYVGPFEGTAVEAQLCGTPAITTDFGAFTETVVHGVTGYRCHNLSEFVWAIKQAPWLDRQAIADRARNLYGLKTVAIQYEEYFDRLTTLWEHGWDKVHDVPSSWSA